jgi:hypothetical protein
MTYRNYEILYKEISVTGYFLARMQLHACRFRLTKKKHTHTEFVLQFSIFNFLTVFGIKITKSPIIPERKADISSKFDMWVDNNVPN